MRGQWLSIRRWGRTGKGRCGIKNRPARHVAIAALLLAVTACSASPKSDSGPAWEPPLPPQPKMLHAFDQAALQRERIEAGWVITKWTGPIRYSFDGFAYDQGRIDFTEKVIARFGAITGMAVSRAEDAKTANMVITFHNEENFTLSNGRKAFCWAQSHGKGFSGVMASAELHLNLSQPPSFGGLLGQATPEQCIVHEMMHAFGISGHTHDTYSILSYTTWRILDITQVDTMLLRTLYDPRMKPGMPRLLALKTANTIMADLRQQALPDEPRPAEPAEFFSSVVEDLKHTAARGNYYAMLQLAHGYETGSLLPQSREQAEAYIEKVATLDNPEARTQLGILYMDGTGVPRSRKRAATLFHWAAERGNAYAQYAYGRQLFDGNGVAVDRPEGLAWLILAARTNNPFYEKQRQHYENLADAGDRMEAMRRADAWKPAATTAK